MKYSRLFVAVLAIATACSVDDALDEPKAVEQEITIEARRADNDQTRTYRDDADGSVWWTPGDAISLFYGSGSNGGSKFTSNATENTLVTNFTGTITAITGGGEISVEDTYFWGLYPYSEDASCDGTSVTMSLSKEQTAVPGSFATNTFPSLGRSQGLIMGFYNICGGVKISVTKEGIKKVTLKSANGELITGKAKVHFEDGIPAAEIIDGSDEVVLEAPAGEYLEVGEFYFIVIFPTTFTNGFTLKFETFTEEATVAMSGKMTAKRSVFGKLARIDGSATYSQKTGGIPIEEDNFKDYLVDTYDTDGDGEISYEEAATIESLELNTGTIESVSGIEYMPQLKTLICRGNEGAKASGGTGKLTSLDVSNNAELEYLDCSYNQISSLDVSNNLELNHLDCSPMNDAAGNNVLSELYVSPGQTISGVTVDRSAEFVPDGTVIKYPGNDIVGPLSFPDENFRTYVFENFDTDGDGFLSAEECNAITRIEVHTDDIESIQGIEYMPNLEILYAFGWETGILKDLDVSNNLALNTIRVDKNPITSIDLSKNAALTYLSVRSCQLSDLDISHNGGLTYLDCCHNSLTSLNLSNNGELDNFQCGGNQLTSLDLSANTKLTKLVCAENQLSGLDISNNPKLTLLTVFSNQITNLDVSNNTELTSIACGNNQLTSIDVSHNTALRTLSCHTNPDLATIYILAGQEITINKPDTTEIVEIVPIEDPVFMEYLQEEAFDSDGDGRISSSEALAIESIKIVNRNLTSVKGIEFMPNLTVLECVFTNLQSVDISHNPLLTIVNFNSKYEPNSGTTVMWSFHSGGRFTVQPQYKNNLTVLDVTSNPNITWLDCTGNNISSLDLSNNTALTDLDCAKNKLSSLDVSNKPDLYWLDCSENELEALNVTANPKLYELRCSDNNLSSLVLSNNPELYSLNCSNNNLTNLDLSGNSKLAGLSANSNKLTSLDLSGCPLLYDIYVSSNMLSSLDISNNPDIKSLDFSSNQISAFDFSGGPNLESLWCGSNPLTNFDISANTKLTQLDCSNLQLNSLDLSNQPALQYLACKQNNLTVLNLNANTQLTYLYVSSNQLETLIVDNCLSLRNMYCDHNHLTNLNVDNCSNLRFFHCDYNYLTALDVSKNPNMYELDCAPMNDNGGNNVLSVLYVAQGQQIANITSNRNDEFIPAGTTITEL